MAGLQVQADAVHQSRGAGLAQTGPGRVHHQPNHLDAGGVPPAADQDTATASSIAAALLSYYTIAQVDGLLAGQAQSHSDDGGADEQILGPADVSLSNWTVRPSSGCVLATHTAGVSVDGYTLTLAANPWNIVRTCNLTPGQELLFACRYRLGTASNFVVYVSEADNVYDPLYGSFAGDEGAWSTAKSQTEWRSCTSVRTSKEEDTAASALLLKHEFLDGGADDVTLATLGVLLEPTLTTLENFLVRSNSQSSVPRPASRHLHADAGRVGPGRGSTTHQGLRPPSSFWTGSESHIVAVGNLCV